MSVAPGQDPRDMFIRATHALAKRDPNGWAEFLAAFDAYTNDELASSTATSVEKLALSMGSVRKLVELRKMFVEIETLMASIEKLRVGRAARG